jgi:thioredoxin-related protein
MKVFSALFLSIFLLANTLKASDWITDFEKAKKEAAASGKMVLLNFSGSDWCGPCIKMKKEIFESSIFSDYAAANLILVRADFPRLKKNKLSKELTKSNEALAAKYNKKGDFPCTVLINAKGEVVKSWIGLAKLTPETMVEEVKKAMAK